MIGITWWVCTHYDEYAVVTSRGHWCLAGAVPGMGFAWQVCKLGAILWPTWHRCAQLYLMLNWTGVINAHDKLEDVDPPVHVIHKQLRL